MLRKQLHTATKRFRNAFQIDPTDFGLKILTFCHHISLASETGRAIAICLMWTVLSEINETEIELYSFHNLSELIKMLNELDDEILQMEENIRIVYILVQCVSFIINAIVFGRNGDLEKAGYRNYFSYKKRELEKLKKIMEKLAGLLRVNVSGDNNFELKMTVSQEEVFLELQKLIFNVYLYRLQNT